MATLKGQNFRVLVHDLSGATPVFRCVAMSTNCTITLTNNTENATTKDVVSMAAAPTTTSKSWQAQVDSLDVSDMGALLTAIKSMATFTVAWDETDTDDNASTEGATFQRVGTAYLSDATFTFNDRENSAKNITFSGTGAIEHDTTIPFGDTTASSYTKGQFVRLFLSSDNTNAPAKVVGAARQLQWHVSVSLENATTKDTTGDWLIQEPTELNYDISTTALVRSNDTITSAVQAQGLSDLETIYEAGTPVKWQVANTSGANQRTKGSVIASGSALLTQLTMNAPNRQSADYTAQLVGVGIYTVGS